MTTKPRITLVGAVARRGSSRRSCLLASVASVALLLATTGCDEDPTPTSASQTVQDTPGDQPNTDVAVEAEKPVGLPDGLLAYMCDGTAPLAWVSLDPATGTQVDLPQIPVLTYEFGAASGLVSADDCSVPTAHLGSLREFSSDGIYRAVTFDRPDGSAGVGVIDAAGTLTDVSGRSGATSDDVVVYGFDPDDNLVFYADDATSAWWSWPLGLPAAPSPVEFPDALLDHSPDGHIDALLDPYRDPGISDSREVVLRYPDGYDGPVETGDEDLLGSSEYLALGTRPFSSSLNCYDLAWVTPTLLACSTYVNYSPVQLLDFATIEGELDPTGDGEVTFDAPVDVTTEEHADARNVVFSPDGTTAAFVEPSETGEWDLFTVPLAPDSEPALVASFVEQPVLAAWIGETPDYVAPTVEPVDDADLPSPDAPCIEAFSGGTITEDKIVGGVDAIYDRTQSLYQVCTGFGVGEEIPMSLGFACSVVAASLMANPAAQFSAKNACRVIAATEVATGQNSIWNAAGGEICGALGDVFAAASGITVAGGLTATGPGAVAVGVRVYQEISTFVDLTCSALWDGESFRWGYNRETQHLSHVRADIVGHENTCLRQRTRFGNVFWAAVDCS